MYNYYENRKGVNMKNKKILIVVGLIIVVIIIVLLLTMLLPKESNDVEQKNNIEYNVVDELYEQLDGPECTENCDTREYVSKLYGYTYDEKNNLEIQVKEEYVENNKVYDLDGKELGDYSEDTLNNTLDSGTLKTYNYTKDGDDYVLAE